MSEDAILYGCLGACIGAITTLAFSIHYALTNGRAVKAMQEEYEEHCKLLEAELKDTTKERDDLERSLDEEMSRTNAEDEAYKRRHDR